MLKNKDKKKKKLISTVLLVLAEILLITGIGILSIDIYSKHKRKNIVNEGTVSMDRAIASMAVSDLREDQDEPQVTMVVDADSLSIYGEGYDYYDESDILLAREQVNEEIENSWHGNVTLQGVGVMDIPSIELHYPIWEETNNTSLRYGLGHYVNSVAPGFTGNCTILGHNMRDYGYMFNRLNEVIIGDEVSITNLRGYVYTYTVDDIEIVSADEMMQMIRGGITDTKQLTLVTCIYTNEGKQRLIVIGHITEDIENA